MALTSQGYVRYTLKTPYRDGTTHISDATPVIVRPHPFCTPTNADNCSTEALSHL